MMIVNISFRLSKKHLEEIDSLVKAGLYKSRSEAIRDAVKELIETKRVSLVTLPRAEPLSPDQVMRELKKIREELWTREKAYFVSKS